MLKITAIPSTQASHRVLAASVVDVAALVHVNPALAANKRLM